MRGAKLAVALLAACGGSVNSLDAGVDSDDPAPCCRFLPDEDAVRACIDPPLPPGTCGVIVCPNPGGGYTRINICGPRGVAP